MNVLLRRTMSLAEFLAWEEGQEPKWEFDGFNPVAMTGVTVAHAIIQGNLIMAVQGRLRGKPCRFFGPELKVLVAGSIRYPDGFVSCGPIVANDRVMDDPVTIFEILSDSTQRTDRTVKAREYQATPSVQRYVMLEQARPAATMHARDGDRWVVTLLFEGDTLALPEIGLEFPLAELYEAVPFEPDPEPGPSEPEQG